MAVPFFCLTKMKIFQVRAGDAARDFTRNGGAVDGQVDQFTQRAC